MIKFPEIRVIPENSSMITLSAHTDNGQVLPKVSIRAFQHHYEITVVDLAGDLIHTIVIRQKGNVEVDE